MTALLTHCHFPPRSEQKEVASPSCMMGRCHFFPTWFTSRRACPGEKPTWPSPCPGPPTQTSSLWP